MTLARGTCGKECFSVLFRVVAGVRGGERGEEWCSAVALRANFISSL